MARFSRPSTKRGPILIGLELNTNARESFESVDVKSFTLHLCTTKYPSNHSMASQSKGAKKRDHIPSMSNNNPLLVTPKPPSKKDKKEQEQEAMQNYTLSTPPQMISVGSPPPPTSQFQQTYQLQNFQPYQYQGSFGSVTEEIGSIKSILTSMMYKLDKLEPMEKSIKEMST